MTTEFDYTFTFLVPVDPVEAFAAAAAPQAWWNVMITGTANQTGDTFVFEVPGLHYSDFRVADAVVGSHLEWEVIASGHENELDEWVGTTVIFDFAADPAGTRITFTHRGLKPQLGCYTVCSSAWAYHLNVGLIAMLSGGTAAPITAENIEEVANTVGARQR